jgi:hypothetical protein
MGSRSFLVRLALGIMGSAALAWTGALVRAADVTPPPPTSPVPVSVGEPGLPGAPGCASCQGGGGAGCATCKHGLAKSKCPQCGKLNVGNLLRRTPNPYPVSLCPGACFGYFQTQWRKWEEVCPYPYLGMGPSQSRPGDLPHPRPVDQKMPEPKKVGGIDIPMLPETTIPNKFGP